VSCSRNYLCSGQLAKREFGEAKMLRVPTLFFGRDKLTVALGEKSNRLVGKLIWITFAGFSKGRV
jgi:hypothetical protein